MNKKPLGKGKYVKAKTPEAKKKTESDYYWILHQKA